MRLRFNAPLATQTQPVVFDCPLSICAEGARIGVLLKGALLNQDRERRI
jgi:hypothetical protein